MSDLAEYYSAVRLQEDELRTTCPTGYTFVTSIRNISKGSAAGTVTEVSLKAAAKHLVDSTAKISTPEEVTAHQSRGASFAVRMNAVEQRRNKGQSVILVRES